LIVSLAAAASINEAAASINIAQPNDTGVRKVSDDVEEITLNS
jgi:hypothetical protein